MHGYAFGLAIDLSCCADIRIASKDTKFSVKEVDIGLAADIGTLARLPKIVGNHSWVKEVTLTARVFGAEEAYRVGFVSHVTENKEKAVEKAVGLATLIASKSPIAVQGTKELLNHARENTTAASKLHTRSFMRIATHCNSSPLHWSLELCRFTYRRRQVCSSVWYPEDEAHVLEVVGGFYTAMYPCLNIP
jgi:enoyl-CoA hydratase/carnithine racemase